MIVARRLFGQCPTVSSRRSGLRPPGFGQARPEFAQAAGAPR
jgi:hypothetical protein